MTGRHQFLIISFKQTVFRKVFMTLGIKLERKYARKISLVLQSVDCSLLHSIADTVKFVVKIIRLNLGVSKIRLSGHQIFAYNKFV